MGVLINFILFLERSIFIDPSSNFLEHGALPNGNTCSNPQLQSRNKCIPNNLPFQFIYMKVELWANHMG
jgi:hypothetical protein